MLLKLPVSSDNSTFIAFIIFLILAITKTNANSNDNDYNNNNFDALSDKAQVPTAAHSAPSLSSPAITWMTSKIVISANSNVATPNNFNKNSLQLQEQEMKIHFVADNNNKRLRGQNAVAAAAVAAAKGNNVNAATDDARNGFHDKINISNQRNEFNNRPETTATTTTTFTNEAEAATSSSSPSPAIATAALKRQVAASSFLESVELQESYAMSALSPDKRQKLLLHRQKRYLLFPEGSSFQLVFDLIIPIVDYTNFAIMGITCAIAWELPSKPPSEIIENFRDKLNDGTFGLSRRRNDTAEDIKYVNDGGGGDGGLDSEKAKVSATELTSADSNFENINPKPIQTDAYYNNNNNNNNNKYYKTNYNNPHTAERTHSPIYSIDNAYYAGFPRRPQNTFKAGGGDFSDFSSDKSSGGSGWKTFNSPPHTKAYSKHYNNNDYHGYYKNRNSGTSGYVDKPEYVADWRTGASAEASYEGRDKYYQRKHQQQQQQEQQQSWTHSKYANTGDNAGSSVSWDKDNWWQRNKQRVQQSWRDKQREWTLPYQNDFSPADTPIYSAPRTGRNRKILTAPPKHHIYPVFGKRRRRRRTSGLSKEDVAFERKLEQIHLREQLQSRQKLYAKVEQLYKVRGHNGTACVLRALCETGQRWQDTKPQTFLTELLRAIFALPVEDAEELQQDEVDHYRAHIAPQYRAAAANCEQHFAECEHSFWTDLKYEM